MPSIAQCLRLTLDLNVFVADIRARQLGTAATACTYLVNAVNAGKSEAGSVQLVVSIPMIENFANVLHRKLGYSKIDAEQRAQFLADIMIEGPMPHPPLLVVAAGIAPFETEARYNQSLANFQKLEGNRKLFHESQDDRYVLEAALAGGSDILATADLSDFDIGDAINLGRDDVLLYPTAGKTLVIGKPSFVAHWMRQGIVPDAGFVESLQS